MSSTIPPGTFEKLSQENPPPSGCFYHLENITDDMVEVYLKRKRRLSPFPRTLNYVAFLHRGNPQEAIAKAMNFLRENQ